MEADSWRHTGDGSYGVARYYVLIAANENLLEEDTDVILDVKQTPTPAVREVVSPAEVHRPGSEKIGLPTQALALCSDH